MNSANSLLIQRAGEAVRVGDMRQARTLLLQAVRQDASDHIAWLGLARIAAMPQASLDYARRAARMQPDDPLTQKVLAWAERRVVSHQQQPMASRQPLRWQTAVIWAGIAIIIAILLGMGGLLLRNGLAGQNMVLDSPQPTETNVAILAQVERSLPGLGDVLAGSEATAVPITATPSPTSPAIQPKQVAEGKAGDPRPTWTVTPSPTNTPTPSPTPIPTFVSANIQQPAGRPFGVGPEEHWVDVNLSNQTLIAFKGNTPVLSTYISSGLPSYPTVTGQFRIWLRYESQTMDGTRLGYDYYLPGVPYVMYFYEDYALHGTYWHNNFGTPMSHGCVNMETGDAQWLFDFTTIGTVVNVHY